MRSRTRVLAALMGSFLPALAVTARAATEPAGNIRIAIEVGRLDGAKKIPTGRYELFTATDGESANLAIGTRLPVPAGAGVSEEATPEGKVSVASYAYQNIGLDAKLRALPGEGGRIRVRGDLHATLLLDAVPSHPSPGGPVIGTVGQDVNLSLRAGRQQRVLTVEEPGIGSFYVEMTAEPVE